MSDDLIERLRRPWFTNGCAQYQLEAADRIEELEAKLSKAMDVIKCILASTYADDHVGYHVALYGAKALLAELEGGE